MSIMGGSAPPFAAFSTTMQPINGPFMEFRQHRLPFVHGPSLATESAMPCYVNVEPPTGMFQMDALQAPWFSMAGNESSFMPIYNSPMENTWTSMPITPITQIQYVDEYYPVNSLQELYTPKLRQCKGRDHHPLRERKEASEDVQREIEIAAARSRIAMLENIFFPSSYAYLKKCEENAKSRRKAEPTRASEDQISQDETVDQVCEEKSESLQLDEKSGSVEKRNSRQSREKNERNSFPSTYALPVYPTYSKEDAQKKDLIGEIQNDSPVSQQPKQIGSADARQQKQNDGPDFQQPIANMIDAHQGTVPSHSERRAPASPHKFLMTVELIRAPIPGRPSQDPHKVGVGILFQATKSTHQIMVTSMVPGSSAANSGKVFPGDFIHSINGNPVQGRSIPEAVAMIRGPEGSKVTFTIEPGPHRVRKVVLRREPLVDKAVISDEKVGVGIAIQATRTTKTIVVISIKSCSVAARCGNIFVGDVIHRINGIPLQGLSIPEVVHMIKGPVGSEVEMELQSYWSAANEHASSMPASMSASFESSPLDNSSRSSVERGHPSQPTTVATRTAQPSQASSPSMTASTRIFNVRLLRKGFNQLGIASPGGGTEKGGIGISFDIHNGMHVLTVLSPNGSAYESGLMSVGDMILSVNGESSAGKDVRQLISEIVGPKDTYVDIVIQKKR